ncbi:MAG: permease prefix domain 1-containing protein [Chloroflexi bacterium]|nr:permease prefix domain 1-containing protein [Chloroflexota bacterium]
MERTGMDAQSHGYLLSLAKQLKLEPNTKEDILRELEGHLEERAAELEKDGLSSQEAYKQAAIDLGRLDVIAKDMYTVHSRGTWRDILLATLPHLLLAALFALHLWTELLVLIVAMAVFTFIAYKGWKTGGAKWTYSWLGYSLAAPTISWLMAFMALGYAAWTFVTTGNLPFGIPLLILLVAYVPFSLWILVNVTLRVVKRDWLLASLTSLPFPFLTSWILFLNWQGGLWAGSTKIQETDSDRAIVFLALAVTTAVFFKVGRRLVQIGLLTLSTTLLVVYTVVAIPLSFGILAIILVGLSSVAFLLSPAILEARLSKRSSAHPPLSDRGEVVTHWFSTPG